jgi:hypothetical protein
LCLHHVLPQAKFFNPYPAAASSRATQSVIEQAWRRDELIKKDPVISLRYDCEVVLPRWKALLSSRGG